MAKVFATVLKSRVASLVCLAVVLLALVLPPGGLSIPLCQFKAVTHYPCLACGLTRSFIGMAHLDFRQAAFFHPLGLVLFPLVLLVAGMLPLRPPARERVARWAEAHPLPLNLFSGVVLLFFVAYGVGRIIWLAGASRPSPW